MSATVLAGLSACGGGGGDASIESALALPQSVQAPAPTEAPVTAAVAATATEKLGAAVTATDVSAKFPERATPAAGMLQTLATPSSLLDSALPSAPVVAAGASRLPSAYTTSAAERVFHVDAVNGNDSNTGTAASGTGIGPWRSLARLQSAGLSPGDTVRLVCGSVWNETLQVPASGTTEAPLSLVAYPAGCANPPVIDGGVVVPPGNWARHSGNVYKTVLGAAQRLLGSAVLSNGDFESGLQGWSIWSPSRTATMQAISGCATGACMRLSSGTDATKNLASSTAFVLTRGATYFAGFSLKAPVDVKVRVTAKRAIAPFDAAGYDVVAVGTGEWQQMAGSFVVPGDFAEVRLDVELLAANSSILFDSLTIAPQSGTVADQAPGLVTSSAGVFTAAHHPNRGFSPALPQSMYLKTASDADRITVNGRIASTYVPVGADLRLPSGISINAGTKVRMRSNAWVIEDGEVASVASGRINLVQPSGMPLAADWGYFLMGQLWMVDSPGEWFYETATSTVYAWMPDSAAPTVPVTLSRLPVGVNAAGRSNVRIEGLTVRQVGVGMSLRRTTAVTVLGARVLDTVGIGIDAGASVSSVIEASRIERTGGDAISATESTGMPATGLRVAYNTVAQSGVRMSGDSVLSVPVRSFAAIRSGLASEVVGNVVADTGYLGIWPMAGSRVSDNYVRGACSVQDDCAGIYTSGSNNNSIIRNNLVMHSRGALPGKPAAALYTQAQGIYVDELGSGVLISGNTVINADHGVQLHVAANNTIEGNKLFGNRVSQIWIQETPKGPLNATRTVSGNIVRSNQIVPTTVGSLGFLQTSDLGDTAVFSRFDENRYFDRIVARVGSERMPGRSVDVTLPQWKAAADLSGQWRNQDPLSFGASQNTYAAYQTTGVSIVPNGNLASGTVGWTIWNASAPFGALADEACAVGRCARYTAGSSASLLSTPFFSVRAGQWYRVTLDLATGADNQPVQVVVRRGGGGLNGYESVNPSTVRLSGMRQLKRYSFVFSAALTVNVNDPVTLDKGARVDFQNIMPSQSVTVANVEMVPISSINDAVRADVLVNPTSATVMKDCPVAASQPAICGNYVRFSDNLPVTWPYALAARSAEAAYTLDRRLVDADADGVADSEDRCPSSPAGQPVNSMGCGIGQTPI